jgi:hypothetical protein
MKKVVIEVPKDKSEKVHARFRDVLFSVTEGEKSTRFTLYIPDDMLDELIHQTNGSVSAQTRPLWTGLIPDYGTADDDDRGALIEVSTPDFVISPFVEKIKEQYSLTKKKSKTPIEEIIAATESYTEFDQNKIILAAIAGLVALIGLFLNNVGVIIGAMLISPLLGPIYALAVYIAIGDVKNNPALHRDTGSDGIHAGGYRCPGHLCALVHYPLNTYFGDTCTAGPECGLCPDGSSSRVCHDDRPVKGYPGRDSRSSYCSCTSPSGSCDRPLSCPVSGGGCEGSHPYSPEHCGSHRRQYHRSLIPPHGSKGFLGTGFVTAFYYPHSLVPCDPHRVSGNRLVPCMTVLMNF